MKKHIKIISFILVLSTMLTVMVGCNSNKPKDNGGSNKGEIVETVDVDLAMPNIRAYISRKNNENALAQMLSDQENKGKNDKEYLDKQNVNFSWESMGNQETFTLSIASDKDFNDILFTYETNATLVEDLGVFIPGKTYYFKVVGSVSGEVEACVNTKRANCFKTKDLPVRYINAGTVLNVRDLGGWTTKDRTKKVKYGMLYRGGALDGFETYNDSLPSYMITRGTSRLNDYAVKVFNEYLGIKGEIDLRGIPEDQHDDVPFNKDGKLCQYSGAVLTTIWTDLDNLTTKRAIKEYFSFLADESNYPIYFHCNGGADRTGALAFLINGLLGVDYKDLAVDYELTSYSFAAGQCRTRSKIEGVGKEAHFLEPDGGDTSAVANCRKMLFSKYNTEDLQQAIEKFLIDCGVTETNIENVKSILLES